MLVGNSRNIYNDKLALTYASQCLCLRKKENKDAQWKQGDKCYIQYGVGGRLYENYTPGQIFIINWCGCGC